MKKTLTVTTPAGTFTRTTEHDYAFAGVVRYPEGSRAARARGRTIEVKWSRNAAGARKAAETMVNNWPGSGGEVVGVYPVDGTAAAE